MRANLHMHSIFSDGTQWPEEMVIRAKYAGYEMIALTDHDTFQGVEKFIDACNKFGIQGIPGVEIDCVAPEFETSPTLFDKEVLGYFPNGLRTNITSTLESIRIHRMEKIKFYLQKAQQLFSDKPEAQNLTYENLIKFKLGFCNENVLDFPFSWNKSNFYYFLQSCHIISEDPFETNPSHGESSYKIFKKTYFTKEKLGLDTSNQKPHLEQIIKKILQDKGYPVLPHYGHIFQDSLEKMQKEREIVSKFLKFCWDLGIWGVECYYYKSHLDQSEQLNNYIRKICAEENLPFHFTYGSDCHGRAHKLSNTLEYYSGNFDGFT